MKRLILAALLTLLVSRRALADDSELNNFLSANLEKAAEKKATAKLDPKRIINESNSFLKEREPEMTDEEYALYEKIVNMLGTNPELAVRLLEAMMEDKEKPSPAFEFILGNAYYNAGEVDKAEARYKSAVDRYPTFVRAWNNLAVLYYTAGKYPDAVTCFSKSVVLGDRDPMTFGLLGYSLERGEDYISAELAFMQALGGDPANPDWKEGLLRISIQEKQYGRAEALVKNLIRDHPQEARYWLTYANIMLSQNRKAEAMVLLEAASGTGVANVEELTLLGDLYADQDLTPEAIAIYQKLLAASPDTGARRILVYARMLTSSGKLKEAGEVLDSLKAGDGPESRIGVLQARADLFAAQKLMPEARKELDAILKLDPFNGKALLSLGRAYAAEGDISRATFAFESAFQVDETKYPASLELANVELRNRHYSKSVEYLQTALKIEKTDAVEDYLARVKTMAVDERPATP